MLNYIHFSHACFLYSLLALGADFSKQADGHLVCIQNVDAGSSESLAYSTQAIDIQGRDRVITGASLLILSGALKASSGLKAKCSIVEDGLMIQISSTKMQNVRDSLKAMKNVEIACGPIDDDKKETEEIVTIEWAADDMSYNAGVVSPIDSMSFEGKESIRMKFDFTSGALNNTRILRWSEVFVLEMDEASGNFSDDHLNFSKLADPIARACGSALLPFLDLMATSQLKKIGIRVTLGENVSFSTILILSISNQILNVNF
jgi:MAD, mothers against decapentaplegic interacting protein